jgi:hypothetical protein
MVVFSNAKSAKNFRKRKFGVGAQYYFTGLTGKHFTGFSGFT